MLLAGRGGFFAGGDVKYDASSPVFAFFKEKKNCNSKRFSTFVPKNENRTRKRI